jgi:hypothetical protein
MRKSWGLLAIIALLLIATRVYATDYQSANFVDRDPVINVSGGKATSAHFQLMSGSGQVVVGQSTSSHFIGNQGFFYYPEVTSPSIGVAAGESQVNVTWTSAVGSLGYIVSGYAVGVSTVSGGPYTFSNVGNVLASNRTGLTNVNGYYFLFRALDFFGD